MFVDIWNPVGVITLTTDQPCFCPAGSSYLITELPKYFNTELLR